MKSNKKIIPYIVLFGLSLFFCWLFSGRLGTFGSEVDWLSQHSVIPDYFRQQFYQTGELFPEFAPSLGGGQNIYNFAYYGLFSPLILPSYLLPFVKMSTYLMAVSFLTLAASVLLFYYWTGRHGFSQSIRFATALLFLLAGPMIFQSYRQIMFVNYMPFLLLTLIGVDIFWEKKRFMLMTTGIFLMIMTSFYYSICGMLVVFIYGIAKFPLKQHRKIHTFFQFILPFFTAVSTSAFLLIPTAGALLVRSGKSTKTQLKNLFIPDFSLEHFTYTGYGIGLSAGILAVLILGIFLFKYSEKLMCILCIIVLTLPVFSWILNGGLYIRDKAFIPFVPLLCYLTASFLQRIQTLFSRKYLPVILLTPFLIYLACAGLYINQELGSNANKELCESLWDSSWKSEIDAALTQEKGLYRMEQDGSLKEDNSNMNRIWNPAQWTTTLYSSAYNQDYQTFLTHTFKTELPYNNAISHSTSGNPLFRKFMGVKRLINKDEKGNISTQLAEYVAPVLYATDRLISSEEYQKLSFPYNQTALMKYAVADDTTKKSTDKKAKIMDSAVPVKLTFPQDSAIHKEGDNYHIQTPKPIDTVLHTELKSDTQKQLFFLQFEVKNAKPNHSVTIKLNGTRNKLSAANHIYHNDNTIFTFVTELEAGQEKIPVTFSDGDYTLTGIKSYTGALSLLTDTSLYQSEFIPDRAHTKGNHISGKISFSQNGYVITSIPFDKGFEVSIDGCAVIPEKVNTAFLGFPLSKGNHHLEITYHAPGAKVGKILSLLGLFLWGFSWFISQYVYQKSRCEHLSGHQPLVHLPKGSLVH